jgi:general secretion pathway protein H
LRGFTLFELLIVLFILSLASAVTAPKIVVAVDSTRTRNAASELASALRTTRSEAIRRNRDLVLVLDVDARTFQQPNRPPREIGRGIMVRMLTAAGERIGSHTAGIRFYSDGSASGGEISLQDGKTRHDVSVDWLSGRVAIRGGPNAS